MLQRIDIPTFSRAVPKKSAIKFCYWASQVQPISTQTSSAQPLSISHAPFVIGPLLLPQESHLSKLTLLLQQQQKNYTQFRSFFKE
ncbi:hypothetical protein I79_003364 [Cricetulus griseus]|uniref:Uncharacterized protein n=1 Tax=Cricetulus griseus TaxID=10029 RepID=G3GZR8_CRIGR|nr:hypothetical protein I79_003364 [Cricetulus griseus]